MTRTFSKIYGLGGLRVGWGYGPKAIIDVLNRIRGPFNLSTVALETAEAAVRDQDYIDRCRADNTRLRAILAEGLAERGVPSDTSTANFVLARFASPDEAEACDEYLKAEADRAPREQLWPAQLPADHGGDEPSCRRVAHVVGQFKNRGKAPK